MTIKDVQQVLYMDEFRNVVVSHMLDALEDVDNDLVAKLEQKMKELKKEM